MRSSALVGTRNKRVRRSAVRVATLEEVCYYGGKLPRGLLPPIAGGSGVALDHALGASIGFSSSETQTVSNIVSVGELVVVFSGDSNIDPSSAITITDSGANSYSYAERTTSNSAIAIAASTITTALTGGSSTVTAASGNVSGSPAVGLGVASFTGCSSNAATAAYGGNQNSVSTTSPSISTSTSVASGDLVIAMIFDVFGINGWTALGAFTALDQASSALGTVAGFYAVASSSGTVTFNPTSSASGSQNMAIAAFPAKLSSIKPRMLMQAVPRVAVR